MLFRRSTLTTEDYKFKPKKILVLGVYLSEKKNFAREISIAFDSSKYHDIDQKWVAIGNGCITNDYTIYHTEKKPKFVILNELLSKIDIKEYDYIIVSDDDVVMKEGFLDKYVDSVEKFDLSLSQPARSIFSELSHVVTKVDSKCIARETNFVEIGPVFMIKRDLYDVILPFDESSPMGWGYDYVWPIIVSKKGLKMGIIDDATVNHGIRKTACFYSASKNHKVMSEFLLRNKHVEIQDSFKILKKNKVG